MASRQMDLGEHAPITEALVDLRVSLPPETDLRALEAIHELVRNEYPKSKPIREFRTTLDTSKGQVDSATKDVGWRFDSEDSLQVLQAQLGGLTISRLKPYLGWDSLRVESERVWRFYSSVLKPTGIHRIAVRFINQFPVPLNLDLDDLFTIAPRTPDTVEPAFHSYQSRVGLSDGDNQGFLGFVINPASSPQASPTVTLDVDVFRTLAVGMEPESAELWQVLDELRAYKNSIFFGSLTDESLNRLKEYGGLDGVS